VWSKTGVLNIAKFNYSLRKFRKKLYYTEKKHGVTVICDLCKEYSTVVGCVAQLAERRSLAGELTLSCARPLANG